MPKDVGAAVDVDMFAAAGLASSSTANDAILLEYVAAIKAIAQKPPPVKPSSLSFWDLQGQRLKPVRRVYMNLGSPEGLHPIRGSVQPTGADGD